MNAFWVNGKPSKTAEDWKWALQDPEKQWRPGYSAWALAHCWQACHGFPPEIQHQLDPHFSNISLVEGWVEYQVAMPGRGKASHNDLFVKATSAEGNLCIAIEGKVNETLGGTVGEWRNGSPNRETRLAGILNVIGLPPTIPNTIRYQLLHRMASPVLAARDVATQHAVMIIHSFSPLDENFADFAAFLELYGIASPDINQLYPLKTVDGIRLYAGWARGDKQFLDEQ